MNRILIFFGMCIYNCQYGMCKKENEATTWRSHLTMLHTLNQYSNALWKFGQLSEAGGRSCQSTYPVPQSWEAEGGLGTQPSELTVSKPSAGGQASIQELWRGCQSRMEKP